MMSFRHSVLLAVSVTLPVLAVGCSCGPGTGDTRQTHPAAVPSTAASLTVDIGGGDQSFTELSDGASVALVAGPQGGYHVWTSVRVTPAVADLTVDLSVTLDDGGASVGPPSGWGAERMTSHDYIEVDGLKAYIDSPTAVVGKTIVIHADVVTPDGRHGSATRKLLVASQP